MRARANNTSLDWAEAAVAEQYRHMLSSFARKKPRVKFANDIDNGSPPLRVQLIDEYMYGDDVEPPDDATILGCQRPCKPHMVHNCGCEHSRECDCLEFAEVDKDRLRDSDLKQYKATKNGTDGDTMGLPKRFPYKMDGTMQSACLGSETRYALYECNTKCNCGPNCKTKVTQRGRKYGLEIFKTKDRGWGLRSTSDLRKGDFVDMYFGKVITYREAESRDNNDYLFDLDKFEVPKEIMLVVDGTNMGGVTRFMNHSCEPNCGIYSISYNKNDVLRYNLAFFAQEPISKGEELTFDYMGSLAYEYDADDFEAKISSSQKPAKSRMKCNCGTSSCRGYLFL
jgi:histone-lysine N-methyltransferase SUV39H